MTDARMYVLEKFIEQGAYAFLPDGVLEEMVEKITLLNEAFMQRTGVYEGELYDDEVACEELHQGMEAAFPAYGMYMLRFTEDYLDYQEDYLTSVDAIEWE